MARASKRDDVLDKADELFEKNGFVATGVNQITQEAGVASMTLYNNFKSKEELIVAALERRSERFFDQLEKHMTAAGPSPREKILSVFDALDVWIVSSTKKRKGFSGCTFVKASIEFSAPSHPAHTVAAAHKRRIVALFERAARDMKHKSPQNLALQLHILVDGAITQAQVLGDAGSAMRARGIAELLLDTAP